MTLLDNIKAAVQLDPNGIPLGYGKQPTRSGTKPWVVAWPDGGNVFGATMRWSDGEHLTVTFHQYGIEYDSALVARRRIKAVCLAQLGAVVDGRRVWSVKNLTSVALDRDDKPDPPIFMLADEWRFTSTPA